tara:strand:+ start:4372 stop:4983 length:612 start_codon:yes stop_codon:yes gene_type:complete
MKLSQSLSSNTFNRYFRCFSGLVLFSYLFFLSASAHHPFEASGQNLSFLEGIISGLAHPILGIDHLLFLLSVGLISRFSFKKWLPLFLLCGLLGAIISQLIPGIVGFEFLMGISLVVSAFVTLEKLPTVIMFPLILCHGYLLGNTMVGVEPSPLIAYFVGMLIIEALVILLGFNICQKFKGQKLLFSGILIGSGLSLTYGLIA